MSALADTGTKRTRSECEDFVTFVKMMRLIIEFCGFFKLIAPDAMTPARSKIIAGSGLELLGGIPI